MLDKIKRWLNPNAELEELAVNLIKKNAEFMLSLDERQREYYLSLHDSWRKEMVKLEKRVFDLERKHEST